MEPFCGGCNSLQHVTGNKIGSDINRYLIAMWKGLQQGQERPRNITKQMFEDAKADFKNNTNEHYSNFLIAWIGFMASFNGTFLTGFSGNNPQKDYIGGAMRSVEKQIDKILDVDFYACSYDELPIPDKSIIYCDIPYRDTSNYKVKKGFDHDRFWAWCALQKKGHRIFVSEYTAPKGIDCVWSREVKCRLNPASIIRPIEKLFVL